MPLDALPPELLLHIVWFLNDIRDKCQLSASCKLFHSLLSSHPWCWSPLNLSRYGDQTTNVVLLSILRNCSIPIVLPNEANNNTRPRSQPNRTIDRVNLSGCWCLTSDAIITLACTLPNLIELHLNRYGYTRIGNAVASIPFEQRDHLYQIRPSHNLSSLAMDLSKEPSLSLTLPESTLQKLLGRCSFLQTLSLQYQQLGTDVCKSFKELKHLRSLDISSCVVTQPALQYLLRGVARQLVSLKMLNIDLSNLTLLCLQQHGTNLRCLHLSCPEPHTLPSIGRVLDCLELEDFRLTRLRAGNIDPIIERLSPTLKRLDLSPKMDIYPKYPRSFPRLFRAYGGMAGRNEARAPVCLRFHTPPRSFESPTRNGNATRTTTNLAGNERPRLQPASYLYRTEHDLGLTDASLYRLRAFTDLVELRLCFPTITASALSLFFKSAPQLRIFELRMIARNENTGDPHRVEESEDYLQSIEYTHRLREIHLYSVWLSDNAVEHLSQIKTLKQITICNGGTIGERKPAFLRRWLLSLPLLETVRIGKMTLRWDLIDDIIQKLPLGNITLPCIQQANGGLTSSDVLTRTMTEGDITFHKRGNWEWYWGASS
ncbi:hypothetical protein EC973_002682 [Apophysomyces ossiformis]|uniref:F-box domain-containing protein n=1 Tax=Apophysomyces ossiformis TaxID=679940 RepID=A0A8H7BI09_9FUNG|nr:hypothetical protein EC973_002682 [Apophysomyces ossiformis]